MKKILLVLFVLMGLCTKAQIVNIPDPVFKANLINEYYLDGNHNNEIDSSEAATVTDFYFDNIGIHDFTGINAFVNLQHFQMTREPVTTLTLSLPNLIWINFGYNYSLTTLNLVNCPLLNIAVCSGNYQLSNLSALTSLNLSGLPSLRTLDASKSKLSSLDLSAVPDLTILRIQANNFNALPDISMLTQLEQFDCGANPLTSFEVSGHPYLDYLNCDNTPMLTSFNVHNCIRLKSLYCRTNPGITSLDLTNHNLDSLENLFLTSCSLTSLNISGLNKLYELDCDYNLFTELDCSNNASLTILHYGYNPQLKAINAKNGPTSNIQYMYADGCPELRYVCTDDNEVQPVYLRPDVSVNSYCSFTPGGTFYNTIKGKVTWDVDNNGCGAGDPALPGLVMKLDNGTQPVYVSNNNLGEYVFYSGTGNFTLTPQTEHPYFASSPASATMSFAASGETHTADFCLTTIGTHPDLEITILAMNTARPGFDANYQLVYKNKGTTTLSGNVELNFEDAKMDLISAAPSATTQAPSLLSWAYSNLAPFESRTIDIVFNLLPPPVNNFNDTLNFTANITPLAGDEEPRDNSFQMRQVVRGSFDPNDKICQEGDRIHITQVGDYVHYMVRFQNIGTDTAFNVVIKDLLATKFDWNSFEMTKASHPCVLKQTDGNKLEFIFENIKLPPSATNEPASHGYIAFKIKTIGTLLVGDSIKNDAAVYFDFNLPVNTNTATSYIYDGIVIPVSIEYFKGAIQSGKHLLNWKANCTSTQATFNIERSINGNNYTNIGTITASNTRCLQPFDFTDNAPVAGINYYRIKMTDIDGKSSYSTVVALLNKKNGFEIVNLLPNPVTDNKAILNVTSAKSQQMNIMVTDVSGRSVYAVSQTAIAGSTQVEMNLSKLAAGVYTITINTGEGERKTLRFVKQ